MELWHLGVVFSVIALITGSIWTYKVYKTQRFIDALRLTFIRALADLCDLTGEYMFWIKDKNGRYIFYSDTLRKVLYPTKTKEEIIGKNDYELVRNTTMEDIKVKDIQLYYDNDKLVVKYRDYNIDDVVCIVSDLIVMKKKTPTRFVELFNHALLDVIKYPIVFRNNVEYIVGIAYIVAVNNVDDIFHKYSQCGNMLSILLNTLHNNRILVLKHDTDTCGVTCGWKKFYDVDQFN